jgi:hypothetical protein
MSITEWCIGNAGRQSFADNAYGNKINANSVCVNIYFACFGSVFHSFGNFHRRENLQNLSEIIKYLPGISQCFVFCKFSFFYRSSPTFEPSTLIFYQI